MIDLLTMFFMIMGGIFVFIAALGTLRMPDLFTRMHASTKSSTLGIGCLVMATAIHFHEPAVVMRAIFISAFLFITAPIAAHMISRAAYFSKERLSEKSVIDELAGHYDPKTHKARSDTK